LLQPPTTAAAAAAAAAAPCTHGEEPGLTTSCGDAKGEAVRPTPRRSGVRVLDDVAPAVALVGTAARGMGGVAVPRDMGVRGLP